MDNGTENVMVEDVEMAFRWDDLDEMAAEKSVLRGSSHSNQVVLLYFINILFVKSKYDTIYYKDAAKLCFLEVLHTY